MLFDELALEGAGNLRIPRPELKHAFVLRPLAEIAPDVSVPGTGMTLAALWARHPEYGAALESVPL